MPLKPGDRVGVFEVISLLGKGGMGEVYRARDTRLGRDVAVKILPEGLKGDGDRLARFDREARVLASLNHPGIAALYGLEDTGGVPCLVMELVPGETLAERLSRGALPLREGLDIGRQVAEALEAAHASGVIHRDLKPANVKVTPDGRVKVLDFGLAKAFQDDPPESDPAESPTITKAATREGAVLGTPAYMSPEQARGQGLDKRTDVWSFGCLLYETLTGQRAFFGQTTSDTLVAVLEREPDWGALPRGTPAAVQSLVQRCTRKERQQRLHDIADARIELQESLNGVGSGRPAGARASDKPRAGGFGLAVLAALTLLAVGYLFFALRSSRPEGAKAPPTLAVLPFHVVDDQDSKGDLGLGLADDIITHLANLEGLRVRSTRSVLPHGGPSVDLQQAGRALNADNVLSGTVRKTSKGYRVSVQLVRATDGSSFWGEIYDVATDELPGLQDRISQKVGGALGVRMEAPGKAARIYRRYTANAAAYEAYLRGRSHLVRSTAEGMAAAAEAFGEALRLDPNYALAHAGLAMASAEMHLRFAPAGEVKAWGEAARTQSQRALALDPDLAEAHQALAAVYGKTDFEWDRTIEESHRALDLNPRLELPYSYLARAFYHLGLLELADKQVRAALALDPENRTEPIRTQGIVALLEGRFAEAVPLLEEVRRMSGKPLSDPYLGLAYYYNGEPTRAEAVLEELGRTPAASASARGRSTLAALLAARGERALATELVRDVAAGKYMDHHVANSLGAACAQLGRADEAIEWLRKAVETGFPCHPWYARDPLLGPLHGHPGFESFMEELRRQQQAAEDRYGQR